jgi:hypothetical protein
MKNPNSPGGPEGGKFLPMSVASTPPTCEAQQVVQLQGTADSVVTSQTISIIPGILDITVSKLRLKEGSNELYENGVVVQCTGDFLCLHCQLSILTALFI